MKPPIDGIDLIRRLRSYHSPIILATSYGADYMLLARLAGARVVIHKFVEPSYLVATIKEAIRQLFGRYGHGDALYDDFDSLTPIY